MSGHSKWHRIKHAKQAADQKKSKEFSRFAREISSTSRAEHDPAKNAALRDAITRAKRANMPQQNIDRILQKKSGDTQKMTYEAFGPGGTALLIKTETDNQNRTVSEIRNMLKKQNGSLSSQGSVQWKFNEDLSPAYPITLSNQDNEMLTNLIQELTNHNDVIRVLTDAA